MIASEYHDLFENEVLTYSGKVMPCTLWQFTILFIFILTRRYWFRREDLQVTTTFYVNFNFIPQQFSMRKCLFLQLKNCVNSCI